jgi:hypothetical protein
MTTANSSSTTISGTMLWKMIARMTSTGATTKDRILRSIEPMFGFIGKSLRVRVTT